MAAATLAPHPTVDAISLMFGPEVTSYDVGAFTGPTAATNLGQAFQGSNQIWSNMVRDLLMEANKNFMTRVVMPMALLTAHHLTVVTTYPSRAINSRVPYEGVARMLTTTVQQRSASAQRRGAQQKFEGDFLTQGRDAGKNFALKMDQLRYSIQATLNYLAAYELSNAPASYRDVLAKRGRLETESLAQLLDMECTFFGAAQKGRASLSSVLAYTDTAITEMEGEKPDMIILPQAMAHLIDVSKRAPVLVPKITPAGVVMDDVGITAAQFNNVTVFFTDSMLVDEGHPPFQPFGNTTFIGQYYTMADGAAGRSHAGWRSEMLNTWIHDEDKDDYSRMRFVTAMERSMRWDADTGAMSNVHVTALTEAKKKYDSKYEPARECGSKYCHDVFHSRHAAVAGEDWYAANTFGDLCRSHHLPDRLLDTCAETYVNGLTPLGYEPGTAEAITAALRALVERSDDALGSTAYYQALRVTNSAHFVPDGPPPTATARLRAGATMRLPVLPAVPAVGTPGREAFDEVPPGICTWMALKALAAHRGIHESGFRKHGVEAAVFVKFIDAAAAHVLATLRDEQSAIRIVLAWVPEWQIALLDNTDLDRMRCAVFNMIIGSPRPPVYMIVSATAVAPPNAPVAARAPWMLTATLLALGMFGRAEWAGVTGGAAIGTLLAPAAAVVPLLTRIAESQPIREALGAPPNVGSLNGYAVLNRTMPVRVDRMNHIAQSITAAMPPAEPNTWVYNVAFRLCNARFNPDLPAANVADPWDPRIVAARCARVVQLLGEMRNTINNAALDAEYDLVVTPAALLNFANLANPDRGTALDADMPPVYIDPVALAAEVATLRSIFEPAPAAAAGAAAGAPAPAAGPLHNVQFRLNDVMRMDRAALTNYFGPSITDAMVPTLRRWILSAAVVAGTALAAGARLNCVHVYDQIRAVTAAVPAPGAPSQWAQTIFGMSKGLIDYLDGPARHHVNIVVAPGDVDTGYDRPLQMLSTETVRRTGIRGMRVQGRAGARTGARPHMIVGGQTVVATAPGAGYGSASIGPNVALAVAANRIRMLYTPDGRSQRLTPLRRMFATVLLMTGIHRDNISAMLTANVMPPLSIVLQRPFIQTTNVGAWVGKGGLSTCAMFYGHEIAKRGWDTGRLVYTVDVRYHCLPFIIRPENMMVIRNLMTTARAANFGMDMFEAPKDILDRNRSVIAKLCSYYDTCREACAENEDIPLPLIISAAGSYGKIEHWNEMAGMRKQQFRAPHLSCDAYYAACHAEYYRDAPNTVPSVRGMQSTSSLPHLCYQGEQYIPDNPTTCRTVYHNAGQLGETGSLPGSAAVRSGGVLYYADQWTERPGLTP